MSSRKVDENSSWCSSSSNSRMASGPLRAHAIRLNPGEDLVPALLQAAGQAMQDQSDSSSSSSSSSSCQSAFVMTAVGSLTEVTLRMAHAGTTEGSSSSSSSNEIRTIQGPLEITSLVGTFAVQQQQPADAASTSPVLLLKHLHMTVSDSNGTAFGGHVINGKIFTTLELVLGTIEGVRFERMHDSRTGFPELVVSSSLQQQQKNS